MHCGKVYSSIVCALLAAAGGWCVAQGGSRAQKNRDATIRPPVAEISSPFAVDAPASQRVPAIAFLPQGSMTAQDRQAVHDVSPVIAKRAAQQGFDLGQGNWTYEQIACPVFPDHLLLFFSRDNGIGDVSKFSAVVPRNGDGSVRILPILRRSYSLFTPAPVNPMTIAIFNALRAHEHPDRKVDWLATGLCYAALTGADVKLPPVGNEPATQNISLVMNSLLQVEEDGDAAVRFYDVEDLQQAKSWNLTFDRHGKLRSVAIIPVPELKPMLIP